MNTQEKNKLAVVRFNKEFIESGNLNTFKELMDEKIVNHAAPPNTPNGPQSMLYFLNEVLRKGFPDLKVEILDQVAEGDKVTTRKEFHATHSGEFMGIPATHKKVIIKVIDIIRLAKGKYVEHWGVSNLAEVVSFLKQ